MKYLLFAAVVHTAVSPQLARAQAVEAPRLEIGGQMSGQAVSMHLQQTLLERGPWQVFGVVGGGVRRPSISFPDFRFVEDGTAVHIGPAVQLQVARRLMLRADVRLELSDQAGLRGMVGAAIPLDQMPAGTRARQRPADSLVNGVAMGTGVGALTGALAGAIIDAVKR